MGGGAPRLGGPGAEEVAVRWEKLFADLEQEYEAAMAAELAAEVADRSRLERGRIALADRLRAHAGHPLALEVTGAGAVQGRLLESGPDWLLMAEATGAPLLVPMDRLVGVTGLGRRAGDPALVSRVDARLDLRVALRRLARSRVAVSLLLISGRRLDGTLDRVGADHVDLAVHPAGEARRPGTVLAVTTIPLSAVALVRSQQA